MLHVLLAAVLGAIIGSFCNVLILRFHGGRTLAGRSACPVCTHALSWYELIPVASYLLQWGRCRACRSRISLQYPLVEIATATTFAAIAAGVPTAPVWFSTTLFACQATLAAALIVIFVYDLRHTTIPDTFVGVAALAALVFQTLTPTGLVVPSMSVLAAGPLLAAPIAVLWYVSGGRWIGLGDAKLMLPMGWFFGLAAGGSVLLVAVWLGAAVGVALVGVRRFVERSAVQQRLLAGARLPRTIQSEIPFGPFIIASAALHVFTDISAMGIVSYLTFSI